MGANKFAPTAENHHQTFDTSRFGFRQDAENMRKLIPFLGLLVFTLPAQAQQVLKQTLPNGLTVLATENRAAPVVAVRVYVRTGSIYEGKYLGAGLSHLFEHNLFEGTATQDKTQLNDELQAIGGQSNAYTSYDVTAYHVTTAKPYFERATAVLADMMRHSTFPDKEVKVQQGVIHNEMNLGEDNPDRALSELFDQTAFRVHPVRYPIIGFPAQFDALTRDDILGYYKSHYTPENTIVSVAGDVSAKTIFATVKKEFGDWPRGAAQTPVLPTEPPQNAPRSATEQMAVSQTYLQMGWHTIPLQSPDLYALDTLAQILGGGDSSRLQREILQRENLVNSIGAYSGTPDYDAGIFAINATMPPQNLAKVEAAIKNQVALIKQNGVTQAELERAQRQIKTSFVFGAMGVENQAEQAAMDELGTGDPNYSKRYVERIGAVTAPQVKAMALKYLKDDGLTTAVIAPKTEAKPAAIAHAKAEDLAQPATLTTLPNGVRLIVRPNAATPTVSLVALGLGGVRLEPKNEAGVASLTAQMLTRGTTKRDAEAIADLVDNLGGSLDGFSGYNAWGVQGQFLKEDWKRGMNLLAESVLEPTFPTDELTKVKAQTASALASQDDDPMNAAALLMRKLYFGNHPYGRSTLGTPDALKNINRDAVAAFWKRELQPKNTVIAVYGDVKPADVEKLTTYLLGHFKAQGAPLPAPAPVVEPAKLTEKTVEKDGVTQTAIWYGFPAINVKNEDRYAIDVLDAAMSGADLPGGRLHEKLRSAELVYVVHAYDNPGIDEGTFVIYAATTKENLPKARAIIDEEVQKVRDAEISPAELERAKSMMISAHAIDDQTNAQQAQSAAADELYGLGYRNDADYAEKINAITLADVQRAAQKYLQPNHSAVAIVGPK